jgi:hypothetical protein
MAAHTSISDPRVTSEERRYGSLEAAIAGLWNDSCGAPMGAPVHDILKAALAEQSARRAQRDAA